MPEIQNRNVILIDDGIAMGSTMRASIKMCKNKQAGNITVASPVAGPDIAADLENMVDEVVILEKPPLFHAVAQVYERWYDVPDEEVVEIMQKYEQLRMERGKKKRID